MTKPGHNTPKMPTAETYGALETAYNFFNERLFGGRLMPCLFVMQRGKAERMGHFHAEIWQSQEVEGYAADEMSINPNTLQSRSLTAILSTLAHEMTHLEQHHFGEPSRNGYHNKEWGDLMDKIGLTPSNTGEPGGKRTGQQMTHYIEDDGPFASACAELLDSGFTIPWLSVDTTPEPKERAASTRTKFTCACCQSNAWGKPDLVIYCGPCDERMMPPELEGEAEAPKAA
jgi:predicted SprT family Zn-dependent metalloprotease